MRQSQSLQKELKYKIRDNFDVLIDYKILETDECSKTRYVIIKTTVPDLGIPELDV